MVPAEPSAAPDPNWNVRIARECYEPLARAGAYEGMSFDFGPTLLRWLESEEPGIYAAVIEADATSRRRLGHGNAVAQPYHHVILPLATPAEKRTEVRWGIHDFESRFGRRPEGMWLPETAVDMETLEVLAESGIAFTVLSPHQLVEAPADGRAVEVALPGGRRISVFAYDGALSHGVAFGELLRDPEAWRKALVEAGPDRLVTAIATDGETFGHHHAGAEESLVGILESVRASRTHRLDNFASALARHGSGGEGEIVAPSSWSCAHGVERWQADCGCKMAPEVDSDQSWRSPLRSALRWLATRIDDTGLVAPDAVPGEPGIASDRGAMFTSCAWFFDDVGGLEPAQVLRYAAHAIDAVAAENAGEAVELERELVSRLAEARSSDPEIGDAGRVYSDTIRAEHPFGGTGRAT